MITGGLFALIPGRALVAAVQDGLTGFYVTASARLLEVGYFFVAIVVGVLTVLYGGLQIHAELNPEGTFQPIDRPIVQILASMVLCLTFAVLLQQDRSTVLIVSVERRRRLGGVRRDRGHREGLADHGDGGRGRSGRSVRPAALAVLEHLGAAVRDRRDRPAAAR